MNSPWHIVRSAICALQAVVGSLRDGTGVAPAEARAADWRSTLLRGGAASDALAETLAPLATAAGADVSDLMRAVRAARAEALEGAPGKRPAERRLYAQLQPLAVESLMQEGQAGGSGVA